MIKELFALVPCAKFESSAYPLYSLVNFQECSSPEPMCQEEMDEFLAEHVLKCGAWPGVEWRLFRVTITHAEWVKSFNEMRGGFKLAAPSYATHSAVTK